MALTFPPSPTNGQVYTDTNTGYRYIFDANTSAWGFSSNNVGMSVSSTPPSNVGSGSMWYNREIGRTFVYYNDGDSSQWVETVPAGSIDTSTIASYVNPIYASLNTNWAYTNTAYTFANIAVNTANTAFPNTSNVSFNGSFNVPNGAVSIGTNLFPTGKFHVTGANGEITRTTATGASGGYNVSFFDNSTPWYFGSAKATINGNINDLYFGSGPGTTNNLIFGTAGTERVRIDPTGNVTVPNVVSAGNLVANRANVDVIYPKTTGGITYIPGHIIQVVNTYYTSQTSQSFSATYGVYTDISGLVATITPKSASSKIYIIVRWFGEYGASSATWNSMWSVKRNGTAIGQPTPNGSGAYGLMMASLSYYVDNAASTPETVNFDYYDSPGSTSAVTYQVTVMSTVGGTIYTNRCVSTDEVGTSSITLMEIAQ